MRFDAEVQKDQHGEAGVKAFKKLLGDFEMQKRILVVDDEMPIREFLKFKLSKRGFEVITAKNEKEFWDNAINQTPDLIILDIWLKNKVGTDVYNDLLDFGFSPEIPVIFITALVEDQFPKKSTPAGKYALYSKPFDFEKLMTGIHNLLNVHA